MGTPTLSLGRLVMYLGLTLSLLPVQIVFMRLGLGYARTLPRWYHSACRRLLGFHTVAIGEISAIRPTLFVSNHTSYLDITLLGAAIPASFVAKSEVAGWPLFGLLAKLQRTVFVERRRSATAGQRDALRQRLDTGDSLILFPEGTSSDGNRVLPFKSGLFAAADAVIDGRPLTIQPVSIAYTRLDGIVIGRQYRPYFAWYGDMALAPHLWRALGLGRVTVEIRFHPPVTLAEFGSRKALAEHCYRAIAAGVDASLSGREPRPETVPAEPLRAATVAGVSVSTAVG